MRGGIEKQCRSRIAKLQKGMAIDVGRVVVNETLSF